MTKPFTLLALMPTLLLAAPKPLFQSQVITDETPGYGVDIDVDLKGAKEMFLVVTDGGNGFTADWADWAEPRLIRADGSEIRLTEVEWKRAQSGFGEVRVNANAVGQTMRSAGSEIAFGIGTHANSIIEYNLPADVKRFKARGVLDEGGTKQGHSTSVQFRVYTENPGPINATDSNSHDPAEAIDGFDIHPELTVQLFASEPMVASPSSIDIDARGRVWVCEVVNYRKHNGERAEGDRILILEDTDGDAKADKSTVFHQGRDVDSAHGICVLGNKALISCGDDVFWLIDDNGDDKADRKELMFTKIGGAQHDHGIHAFHFGPDGRLYFNFGNAGKQLCDKNGNLITDIHGVKCTNQNNRPYQQGMVFRCELDGSNVEVLAWNFRNNWEVAVDSFGTMWQSDNDDDGNKGVRINYVMEFGNYGYSDEMTGAGWQTPRIGWESEIPQRHWHQNDPGVVPNMLMTGAGSPTGMQVYEGDLLPSIFHGQPIHCDAGPNVVRGYITQPDGAGYKAEIVNIIQGNKDRWFRPSDVAVAPDGSLIVADWYDPGVGGHAMGDVTRGRLFRVTTKAAEKYECPSLDKRDIDSVSGAITALKSPNESLRYLGWEMLERMRDASAPALLSLLDDKKAEPQHRARALWMYENNLRRDLDSLKKAGKTENSIDPQEYLKKSKDKTLDRALTDSDENIRITAIRAARQLYREQPEKLREVVAKIVKDSSAAVRREAAIALRFDSSAQATQLWKNLRLELPGLPETLPGEDQLFAWKWMIEALGVGADVFPSSRWAASPIVGVYIMPKHWFDQALCWRSQCREEQIWTWPIKLALARNEKGELLPMASPLIGSPLAPLRSLQQMSSLEKFSGPDVAQRLKYEVKETARSIFMSGEPETALIAGSLLSRDDLAKDPAAQARLDSLLKPVIGKPEFVSLVERLNLTGFEKELFDYILANPNAPESITAAKMLAANRDGTTALLEKSDPKSATALVNVLGRVGDRASVAVLNQAFWKLKDNSVRNTAIEALALTSEGARNILRWHGEKKLPEAQLTTAALALSRSTDAGVRNEAASALPLPAAQGLQNFPGIPELMKLTGDATKGQTAFAAAGCVGCHQVKGQFINFGPDLSLIGNKLSKDALFTAILYPSAGIEHSFNGVSISTKAGAQILGYVISDTTDELTLKIAGGAQQVVKKADITKKDEMKDSLMPPGLAAGIGPQGLADLVAYLQTLK